MITYCKSRPLILNVQEKAEKCTVRLAQKLEKAGFKESRLWKMVKDNEASVEGFVDEMKVVVMNETIDVDYDSKKIKDRMDADLLRDGSFFRFESYLYFVFIKKGPK